MSICKAEKLYGQAFAGREKLLGFSHPDTLATVQNVADSYRLQGWLDEAKALYLRALQGRESENKLGPDHLDTLRTVEGLGLVAEAQGQCNEAEKLYRRALHGFQKQMLDRCPEVL